MTVALGVNTAVLIPKEHLDTGIKRAETGVADKSENCGQEQQRRDCDAAHSLKREVEESLARNFESPCRTAEQEVDDAEYDLTAEHEVVAHAIQRDRNAKKPFAVILNKLLHAKKQEREQRDDFVELVEENIINLEPGKSVKQCAENGIAFVFYKALEIGICEYRRNRELEYIYRRHKIRSPACGEQAHDPEKRTAEKVVRIAPDEIGAEVGVPVPAEVAFVNHTHTMLIEGKLLDVVVAVIEEYRFTCTYPFHNDERENYQ